MAVTQFIPHCFDHPDEELIGVYESGELVGWGCVKCAQTVPFRSPFIYKGESDE